MRVAVYTIAKNEKQHVERWVASAQDADLLVVADTGSWDGTIGALRATKRVHVARVKVDPWRFDVARNLSLAEIPEDFDYCVALDMDEELQPGWRAVLEDAHARGITRPCYRYTWSWNPDGSPGLVYGGDKIHLRAGQWRHPVHEIFAPDGPEVQGEVGLEIHHHPDSSKSRAGYLPLLALAVEEDPDDDRNAHYHGRELMNAGRLAEAAVELKRHLALPRAIWRPERAASMRYLARCEPHLAETWLLRACAEAPDFREPWTDLAMHHYNGNRWPSCYAAATRALEIQEHQLEYLNEATAWGALPHDLAAVSARCLGMATRARHHGRLALEHDPGDERLHHNLQVYVSEVPTP